MTAKYLALDVESGGLNHNETSVLEYYFIVLDENLNELNSLHLLTKPDDGVYKVNPDAMAVNKIDLIEHNKVAIPEREAKTKLYNFLDKVTEGGKEKLIWVGHNVHFDRDAVFAKLLTRNTCDKFCKYYVLDTGAIAQFLKVCGVMPEEVGGSLTSLIEYYQVDGSNSHRAEDDIRATIEVLSEMKDSIKDLQLLGKVLVDSLT